MPHEVVERIVDTARRGPSAGFTQGVDFLVLDQPEARDRFFEITGGSAVDEAALETAPPVIVLVFSDPERYLDRYSAPDKIEFGMSVAGRWPVPFWDTDAAMACMLVLLTAIDEGLGGFLFGLFQGEAELRSELGVPDDRHLIGVIGLGHPMSDLAPAIPAGRYRRPLANQVHHNRWNPAPAADDRFWA